MSLIELLGAIDIRDRLPRANWSIGQRSKTTSATWHYNGPPVPEDRQSGDGLIAQLIADAHYQMRAGWGGTTNGADGLMYHLVFGANGAIYLARDLEAMLWHAAHQDANSRGLALHFPLGEGQYPTSAQLFAAEKATDILRSAFSIPRDRIFGHLEWKHTTACPGPVLMASLISYRARAVPVPVPTPIPPGIRCWQINSLYTDPVRVHTAPRLDSPVATRLKPGTVVYIDVVKDSEVPDPAHPKWVHMARVPNEQADAGFLAEDCGVWV